MGDKIILGCAYCEREGGDLELCCRRHARLTCPECHQHPSFLAEHPQPVAAAS